MTPRQAAAWTLLLLALGACRGIASVHDLRYVPAEAGCTPTPLPEGGNGRIRLVNAGTQGASADFCMRTSGTSDWGAPVFASQQRDCAAGLAYAQATTLLAIPVGTYDVEAISAGSTCAEAATSQTTGVVVGDVEQGAVGMTILRMGGGSSAERIVALNEGGDLAGTAVHLRVVNALSGNAAINVGLALSPSLPTSITGPELPQPILPGGVEPPGSSTIAPTIDAAGYLTMLPKLEVAVVFDGQSGALFVVSTPPVADTQTLFAIGDPGDTAHAVRGLYCEDASTGGGILASCALSTLPSIAVDTFPAGLYGAAAPFQSQRRPAVFAAIAARQTDLMCLADVDAPSDQAGIAEAASSNFPYAYYLRPPADLDTLASDPTGVDGETPPAPTSAPCSGQDSDNIDAFYACMAQHCSSTGDLSGTVDTTACVSGQCAAQATAFYQQGPRQNVCFDCMAYYLLSEPLADGKDKCVNDARQPFAFEGATQSMILSRYPLENTQAFFLPSTGFRRAVMYAEVELEDQPIDFYCTELSTLSVDTELPYTGAYGKDGTTAPPDGGAIENGWEDEQDLQVQKVLAFVQANSKKTGNAAIIAGLWQSSTRYANANGNVVVDDYAPEVLAALEGPFDLAEPPGYVPVCTFCPAPQNPLNGNTAPRAASPMFLLGFPPGSTTDDTVWGADNDIPIQGNAYEPAPPGSRGPLTQDYPHLVRVTRPPR